jgi:outer membrane lipoprotein-sorting protein
MSKMRKAAFLVTILSFLTLLSIPMQAQNLTAREIIEKANAKMRGLSSQGEVKMTIIRPTWKREMQMKSWSKGDNLMLIVVTAPARDKGTAFLKRNKEIWNWQPGIERTIKLPPSMMMQSWMGSDFTNDDLVRQASVVEDYTHKILGSEVLLDRDCYKIALTPKDNSAVVWGKVMLWVDKKDFMELKSEFYDEDSYLVQTIVGKNIKLLGGKMLPTVLEVTPADNPGQKTVIEYLNLAFDKPIPDSFFSLQNMKRVN